MAAGWLLGKWRALFTGGQLSLVASQWHALPQTSARGSQEARYESSASWRRSWRSGWLAGSFAALLEKETKARKLGAKWADNDE